MGWIISASECIVNGVSHPDGSQWHDGCKECRCQNGVASCQQQPCNCSSISNKVDHHQCCPQCSQTDQQQTRKCHQGTKEYHNGQKWLSQCQECECMVILENDLCTGLLVKNLDWYIAERWNRLLAHGMSSHFLHSSHFKARPLLPHMPRQWPRPATTALPS